MKYIFYDTDATGQQELDIDGDAYHDLLSTCFNYCSTFSMLVNREISNDSRLKALEKYRLPVTENVKAAYLHYDYCENLNCANDGVEIRHYELTPETRAAIPQFCNSIFKWINAWGHTNPEDPAFFREDGSVFFSSLIHEGECTIYPNANENISEIVLGNHWQIEE